jgi:MFS family permease
MALVKSLGYVTLFTGLGYSPIRHFNDVFLILSFFLYLKRLNSGWLFAAFVAARSGVLLDRIYGTFGFVALMSVLVIKNLVGQGTPIERWGILAGIFSFAAFFWFSGTVVAPNPYVGGFLDGVWGFPGSGARTLFIILGSLGALISIAYLMWRGVDKQIYFSLFLVLYFQVLAFYWLVIPNYGHWYAILPIAFIATASLIRFGFSNIWSVRVENLIVTIASIAVVLFSFFSSYRFVHSLNEITRLEDSHKVFEWPFSNTRIRSTMDPELFIDAVGLVNRWAPGKSIYIISQFDTLITWLSGKYSLMPHFDLVSFLNGPSAHEKVLGFVGDNKPEIIFVDSCVECESSRLNFGRDGLPFVPYVFNLLIDQNADRLARLGNVFDAIRDDYDLVERGMLLSVYKRKTID